MQLYPTLKDETNKGIFQWLKYVVRARSDDVQEFNNLQNIFILGRKVGKIPSASNDVSADDKIGDFNVTDTFIYYLVTSGGSAVWRRVAVSSW